MSQPTQEEMDQLEIEQGPSWGLYLIPRKLAPKVGFLVTVNAKGKRVWRAFNIKSTRWTRADEVPAGKGDYQADDIDSLIDWMGQEGATQSERDDAEYLIALRGGNELSVARCLRQLEATQAEMKSQIDEGLGHNPHLLEAEQFIRLAIPLLRGAKAKVDLHLADDHV